MADKAKAGDIRSGGSFYEIYAVDGVTKVLEGIKARIQGFASFMRRSGLFAAGAGGALAAGPMGFLLGGFNRSAEVARMAEFSQQFKVPIEVMNRLKYAADQAGVSVGEVMSDTMGRFRHLINRAPVIDPGQAREALAIQMQFKDATLALQNAMLPLAKYVTPLVSGFAAFVKTNAAGITVVAGLGVGLMVLGKAAFLLGTGISLAFVAGKLLFAGLMLLLTPVGALAAGLAGLVAWWATTSESGKKAASDLVAAFKGVGQTFGETWGGIVNAVKGGELKLAFEIAATGIRAIWYEMLIGLGKAFSAWIEDNRTKIVALGAILGAMKAGAMGARAFGPWGLLAAVPGGVAGGLGADALADALSGLGNNPGLEAKLRQAKAELAALGKHAAAAAIAAEMVPDARDERVQRTFEAVKGGFNMAASQQQFGYGDKARVDELTRQIAANTANMVKELARVAQLFMMR